MHTRIFFDVENLLCEVIQSDNSIKEYKRECFSLDSKYLSLEEAVEAVKKWYEKCNPQINYAPVL